MTGVFPLWKKQCPCWSSGKRDGGLFISQVFDRYQEGIWTGDKKNGTNAAWNVNFKYGLVTWSQVNYHGFVRPVRSLKKLSQSSSESNLSRQHEDTTTSLRLREGLKEGTIRCEKWVEGCMIVEDEFHITLIWDFQTYL